LRELRETPGERVIGFVDDDPRLRRRRIQGVQVVGAIEEIGWVLGRFEPDSVLVTIPRRRASASTRSSKLLARRRPCRSSAARSTSIPASSSAQQSSERDGNSFPARGRARAVPERTFNDRVIAVLRSSVYVWLCIVFLVEAWNRVTPWLFTTSWS
jgi:Predicted nucleoside-diphosphate sugar epimerases